MAMEARCYHGGDGRTKMKPLRYKKIDFVAYLILFGYLGLVIASGFWF
jgi:energy-coupling factor transport system permease protein